MILLGTFEQESAVVKIHTDYCWVAQELLPVSGGEDFLEDGFCCVPFGKHWMREQCDGFPTEELKEKYHFVDIQDLGLDFGKWQQRINKEEDKDKKILAKQKKVC